MKEIELSVIYARESAITVLEKLLKKFESKNRIRVRITPLTWADAWAELVRVALYHKGPDVSEIGSTWICDLANMGALHSFTKQEINKFDEADSFFPTSWNSTKIAGKNQVWAIPWFEDTRILYYRKDILQNLDIEKNSAFLSHEQLIKTLGNLQENSIAIPLSLPNSQSWMILQSLATGCGELEEISSTRMEIISNLTVRKHYKDLKNISI